MTAYAKYPSLVDHCVLVTGGASGIGATLVTEFASQGARVAFIDIDAAAARRLVQSLPGVRHTPVFRRVDVTDLQALETAISELSRQLGPFRALMNNAASDTRHAIADTTPQTWDAGMAVNLRHQFFAAKYIAEDMKASGGAIVNFGSISWMLKQKNLPVYATSKAAVNGLTRSLARELGEWKIRVNTLVPGWTMTDKQVKLWVDDAAREEIARGQCINAPLMPQDIARMALFLAADDSSMCTGQEFIVDGGWV